MRMPCLLAAVCLFANAPAFAARGDEPAPPDEDWPGAAPPEFPPDGEPPPPEEPPLTPDEPDQPDEPHYPGEASPNGTLRNEPPGPFAQGKIRLGIGGGLLSSRDAVDFGLEVGFGYFILDNIELGIDGAFQFGDSPFAAYLGPTARILFPINEVVAPYVGGFYRHWFLTDGLLDFDTLGARAGLSIRTGGAFFTIGLVYEAIVSACDGECADLYPELGVSVLF